jgi:hypothetical protein
MVNASKTPSKVELETKLLSLKTTDNLKRKILKTVIRLQEKDSCVLHKKKQIDLLRLTLKAIR